MKKAYAPLLLAAGLLGCRHDADSPSPDALPGTWRLTNLTCYCAPAPLPNEVLVLEATQHFRIYLNGAMQAEGTYSIVLGSTCGSTTSRPVLRFAPSSSSVAISPGTYTVQDGVLVIDQGGPCDAPVKTYRRQY